MRIISRISLRALALALFSIASFAQQIPPAMQNAVGHWQVMDDNGKPNGQVETYLVNGQLFGKVTQLKPSRHPGDVCDKCSGELKNQPILGMVFLRNFKPDGEKPDGEQWSGGTVVDPDNGKEYRGKVWNEGKDKLHLRGFIGISLLGRSQSWVRIP